MEGPAWGPGDGAIISPSFAYGFSTSIHGNLYHLEGQKLLYPAGQFFAIIGAEDGKASFIATHSSVRAVKGLRLANNKKYLAAVEETYDADAQQVSVYNIPAEKRVRTLTLDKQQTHATTIVGISFSGDGKLLMVAAGEPDYTILLWRWHSNKLAMTINPDCQVCCAVMNPWDESLLAVASKHLVRSYSMDFGNTTVRPSNHLMLDHNGDTGVTCLVYLVGGLLAIGTSTGKILVYNEVGLACSLDISTASPDSSNDKQQSDLTAVQQLPPSPRGSVRPSAIGSSRQAISFISGSSQTPRDAAAATAANRNAVQALVKRGRGFVAAGSNWDVYLFDPPAATTKRTSSSETYTLAWRLSYSTSLGKAPNPSAVFLSSSGASGNTSDGLAADAKVLGLSVSVTDDHLALTTAAGKLLLLDLTAALEAKQQAEGDATAASSGSSSGVAAVAVQPAAGDSESGAVDSIMSDDEQDDSEPNPAGWQVLCAGFPSARVVGLDACQHLPLLLVVSEDKWIRVWDWVRRTRVAARYLASEQPLCCALHPSGLMAALGTTEGLVLYYILRRELATITDLPVAKCSVVRYSHGGSMLAAVGRSNAIVVYPAYYGAGAGASGVNPAQWHGNTTSYYTEHSHSGGRKGGGEGGDIGSEGACLMRPLHVLKAHVSTVTDLVFSGDDKRLVSSGAGGAVYFWDLSTGSRLMELEYVDKKCVYYAAAYHDRAEAAVVRTMDGQLQHLQDGRLAYEVAGLGNDASPMVLTGDGRVVLAATSRGSVVSIPWPKDPEAAGQQQQTGIAVNSTGGAVPAQPQDYAPGFLLDDASDAKQQANAHAGLLKHLSVQVQSGGSVSPRSSIATPGSTAGKTPGSALAAKTPHSAKQTTGAARSSAVGQAAAGSPLQANSNQQQGSVPGKQPDVVSEQGDTAAGGVTSTHQGFKEYRLHAARITAMRVLHTSGLLFTASSDGLVIMSSLTLVLDGIATDPPPLALPPSAAISSTAAAAAAQIAMGANPSPIATGLAAGIGAVVVPGAVPGLPLPVVMVDEGYVLALRERIKAMALQVVAIRKDAQYQVLRQTQALKESLGMSDNQAAALQQEVAALRKALADSQLAADAAQQQAVKELESLHAAAAEQLEGLYEARLALEAERLAQLRAAKDDLELALKEEMKRRSAASEQLLAEVHAMYRQQLSEEAVKAESAAASAAENAAMWQEVLMQTEEDLEQQAEKDGEKLALAQHQASETEMKLKAEIHIINRTNARLKADKAEDMSKISQLTKQVENLNAKLSEAAAGADKLRRELAERDGVIAENYQTLQGLRRRVQELETHKFVLTYKADAAAAELQPKEEQITTMQHTMDAQDRELLAGHSALLAAQRAVTEKNTAVSAAKQEVWEAKQTITRQAGMLDAVAHDIFNVLQQPDERVAGGRTARQQALEALALKYCTNRGGGPRSSVQVEQEMLAHIAAAERRSKLLEGQLKEALESKKRGSRHLMADNTALLADLSELAKMNRDLQRQLTAATNQLAHFGLRLSGTNITSLFGSEEPAEAAGDSGAAAAQRDGAGAAPSAANNRALAVRSQSAAARGPAAAAAAVAGQSPAGSSSNSRLGSPGVGGNLRSQGGLSPRGRLLPGDAGRVMSAALEQQQMQLDELKSVLAATANVVAHQAAHIHRLQDKAGAIQQAQSAAAVADTGQQQAASKQDPTEAALAAVERKAAALGAGSYVSSGVGFARGLSAMFDEEDSSNPSASSKAGGMRQGQTGSIGISRPATAGPGTRPVSRGSSAAAAGSNSPSARPRSASTGRSRPSTASPTARPSGALGSPGGRLGAGGAGHQSGLGDGLAAGRHSPPAGLPKRRPTTAGGVGMLACLKSDLEAWRTK